ncbi:putative glutathione S-transferase [Aaosphaeria arxii CBS 175.79]|uniref:Putative glutathione S-transferase n=1 Tax=Aaosphaeria arxii CBS 175.79 TaxID=1450172 RepID=A0A6A5XV35_9PLEO|nr:putative glutathione S-transferase [Aaosphaeria arxii CBS 175.79]KAF2016677.1 putative glutathione S-transferase [Aaosphaeria arxii CBS 175.79]
MAEPPSPPNPQPSKQTIIPKLHLLAHSQAQRVLWILEELSASKGLHYELERYPRSRASLASLSKIHPLGKSPILTLSTTDSSPPPTIQVQPGLLTESVSILQYLSDEFGGDTYVPESLEDKRRDAFFTVFAADTLSLKNDFAIIYDVPAQVVPWGFKTIVWALTRPMVNHWLSDLQPIYQLLEDALSDEKPWFAGKKMGLSDVNMTWGMDVSVHRKYIDLKKFPKLAEWYERIESREGYQSALKKGLGFDLNSWGQ